MNRIKAIYHKYRNGIIFTLAFHILVFVVLNISQFRKKVTFHEPEIVIDFPEPVVEEVQKPEEKTNNEQGERNNRTNVASNRAAEKRNKIFDKEYLEELAKAQELVKNVSKQLSKDIPTIDDLKMPVEKSEGIDPDSIMKKLYAGDSNVEYFLKDRYHIELPIPVYLSQYGGTVKVNIVVNNNGNVVSAKIPDGQTSNEQLLSYAKTAALRTQFNPANQANAIQNGYIIYHFIAQ